MHKPDQPQITNTATSRDAAAQISADDYYAKAKAIRNGALKKWDGSEYAAAYDLAIQLQLLTSRDKFERDTAKAEIRHLVKLGKGE